MLWLQLWADEGIGLARAGSDLQVYLPSVSRLSGCSGLRLDAGDHHNHIAHEDHEHHYHGGVVPRDINALRLRRFHRLRLGSECRRRWDLLPQLQRRRCRLRPLSYAKPLCRLGMRLNLRPVHVRHFPCGLRVGSRHDKVRGARVLRGYTLQRVPSAIKMPETSHCCHVSDRRRHPWR